jgi:DNA-binding NarL/FixJ family response regulator
VPVPLRVFLIGVDLEDLDRLRARSHASLGVEVAGSALLEDIERSTARLPESIDAILTSPAVWTRSHRPIGPQQRAPQESDRLSEELTTRERDVLALLADGYPNRTIAARLGISDHTVKFHLASLFGKLGVSTRTQAVRRALEWGIIDI